MGKYSIEFVKKLIDENKSSKRWKEIVIILSSALEKWKYIETTDIHKELPGASFVMLPLARNEIGPQAIIRKNRAHIDAYIQQTYGRDDTKIDFLMLSPMQGELCSVFPSLPSVYNVALCYDLIPLMFWRIYLQTPITANEYLTKLRELFRADAYACISKTCANDLTLYLGIDKARAITINGGPIIHSHEEKEYSITKPFFLMPTGNDLRKNNRRAVQAFREFNDLHASKFQLVITSFFSEQEKNTYKSICEDVVFTGNVSGEELNYLYAKAEGLLFLPHYEGLGLPILEAMLAKIPVVCSDISVFREISLEGIEYCDENSQEDIVRALNIVASSDYLVDGGLYGDVLKRYSWGETAKLFTDKVIGERARLCSYNSGDKQRVVASGADPSDKYDATALLMQYAHAELSRRCDLDYTTYVSGEREVARMNYLAYVSSHTDSLDSDKARTKLYFIDNSPSYVMPVLGALAEPGVVVLAAPTIANVWDAALAKGKIDKSRYDAEELLSSRLGKKGSWLASIVASGSQFIVFDAAVKSTLLSLAKKLQKEVRVELIEMPQLELPYPDILPSKSNVTATEIDQGGGILTRVIRRGDDLSYFDAISRCSRHLTAEKTPNFINSIMLALGTEPVDSVGLPIVDKPIRHPTMSLFTSMLSEMLNGDRG
jgi:glycosyltransferase involved in cell wall biosynthesis